MWRWRTLVRQLCVGPRAHGLIGTYQSEPPDSTRLMTSSYYNIIILKYSFCT